MERYVDLYQRSNSSLEEFRKYPATCDGYRVLSQLIPQYAKASSTMPTRYKVVEKCHRDGSEFLILEKQS